VSNFTAVQGAVYSVLSSDTVLPTLSIDGTPVMVYDHVPQDSVFPYVQLGEVVIETSEMDQYGQGITDQQVQIHVWSHQFGMLEVKTILDRVNILLHNKKLPLGGNEMVCRRVLSTVTMQPDGETRHGIMRFRIISGY
jgi:hypothetical protein